MWTTSQAHIWSDAGTHATYRQVYGFDFIAICIE